MLDLGADAGLGLLDLLHQFAQRRSRQLLAFAGAHRHMPRDRQFQILFALFHALITRITEHGGLVAVQQGVRLGDVVHVGRRAHEGVHQAGLGIHTNVRFHAEVPLVAFLGLVHFGIAPPGLVLGGRRGCNQGGIHKGTFAQEQPFACQVGVDRIEDGFGQVVLFQQAAEFQQGGGIGGCFAAEVNTYKAADGLAVVQRVFYPF